MRAISLALLFVGCGGAEAPASFDGSPGAGTGGATFAASSVPSATGGQEATGGSVSTGGASEAPATGGASIVKATSPGGSSGATTSAVATGGRTTTVATGGSATGGKATGGTFATGGAPPATGGSATGGASFLPQGIAGAVGYACPPEVAKLDPPVVAARYVTEQGFKLCEGIKFKSEQPNLSEWLHPALHLSDMSDPRTVLTSSDQWCTRQLFVLIDMSKKWCVETGPEAPPPGVFEPLAIAKEITGVFWQLWDAHTPGADGKCPFTCADFGL